VVTSATRCQPALCPRRPMPAENLINRPLYVTHLLKHTRCRLARPLAVRHPARSGLLCSGLDLP
jgi:hypothetical protein